MHKEYLGDGVYVETDFGVRLYTSDGYDVQNEIFLEPEIIKALLEFLKNNGSF